MAALDGMVLEHLADRLFTPDRLAVVLQAFVARSVESDGTRREQLAQARRALTEAEGRIDRLLQMVEQGLMSLDDPALKERLETAKNARRAAAERVKMLDGVENVGASVITPDKIDRVGAALREALKSGDPAFRKAYLRLFVDLVLVGDKEVQLRGPTIALAKAASAGQLPPAAGVVPSFVQEWRPLRDSNPCYRRERAVSWASRRTGRAARWGSGPPSHGQAATAQAGAASVMMKPGFTAPFHSSARRCPARCSGTRSGPATPRPTRHPAPGTASPSTAGRRPRLRRRRGSPSTSRPTRSARTTRARCSTSTGSSLPAPNGASRPRCCASSVVAPATAKRALHRQVRRTRQRRGRRQPLVQEGVERLDPRRRQRKPRRHADGRRRSSGCPPGAPRSPPPPGRAPAPSGRSPWRRRRRSRRRRPAG